MPKLQGNGGVHCIWDTGMVLAPMKIYPKGFPRASFTFKGPEGAVYARSESGCVDAALFLSEMKNVPARHSSTMYGTSLHQ